MAGVYPCHTGMSHEEHTRLACESVYGECESAACHGFEFYKGKGRSDSHKTHHTRYEFVYVNGGAAQKDIATGGLSSRFNTFVRKTGDGCTTKWDLVLGELGTDMNVEGNLFSYIFDHDFG